MTTALSERKLARIRVALPGGATVDIPVVQSAPFVVAADGYQEHVLYLRNGENNRTVRVQSVPSINGEETINVERIIKFPIKTMSEQAQERDFYVRNTDPPPIQLDGTSLPSHEQVRYVRFYSADANAWVDVELITKLKIVCAAEQYQEWMLYIRPDDPGDVIADGRVPYVVTRGTCPPDLELLTGDGFNPPYRLDPFQNIVTFAGDEAGSPIAKTLGGFTAGDSPFTASWVREDMTASVAEALATGTAFIADTIDMRLVEQPFEPYTYSTADTIHGFTQEEWDLEFHPGGLWYQARLDFIAANPGRDPNLLNDEFYYPSLNELSDAWWQRFIDSGLVSGNPRPYVWVRWVSIDGAGVRH